jgi:hypothetical protein
MLTVLFSDFPRDTDISLNDVYWDIASLAKRELGCSTQFVRNGVFEEAVNGADAVVVFQDFARNKHLVRLAKERGCPVIELASSPFNKVWENFQQAIWEIEVKKTP